MQERSECLIEPELYEVGGLYKGVKEQRGHASVVRYQSFAGKLSPFSRPHTYRLLDVRTDPCIYVTVRLYAYLERYVCICWHRVYARQLGACMRVSSMEVWRALDVDTRTMRVWRHVPGDYPVVYGGVECPDVTTAGYAKYLHGSRCSAVRSGDSLVKVQV